MRADTFIRELILFFEPLGTAAQSPVNARRFLREFGYVLSGDAQALIAAVQNGDPSLADALAEAGRAALRGGADFDMARRVFFALAELRSNSAVRAEIDSVEDVYVELFDYLARVYLGFRAPLAVSVLSALGVLEEEVVSPDAPGGRDLAYLRVRFRWSRLGTFLTDTGAWAYDVYRWDGAPNKGDGRLFDHQLAIGRMEMLIESSQLAQAIVRRMSAAELRLFLKNAPPGEYRKVNLPVIQQTFVDVGSDLQPTFAKEAGLAALPSGDAAAPKTLGLAFAPYASGSVAATTQLTPRLSLSVHGAGAASGGAFVTINPQGIGVTGGAAVDAAFEFGALYAEPDATPVILLGARDSSNIRADAVIASVGGNLAGDLYAAGGFQGLAALIDFRSDGLLGSLMPRPVEIDAGSILLGWRTGRGVYFEGGTGVTVTVPLDLDLGPVTIEELALGISWGQALTVSLTVTGEAMIGPVFARVERVGLRMKIVEAPAGDGLFGRYDGSFSFLPPTGYALSLEAEPVTGGGLVSVNGTEYRGALALNFESFGFSAFAILNTRLPGGQPGFSLAASIFGSFNLPLGYGFFLTGLGGFIGINRTIDTNAMREVLYAGNLDSLLFPSDPIANAARILDDMAAILPVKEGQHLVGPVARISWGQPTLIDIKLGIVIEMGDQVRLLVLGGLGSSLPTRDAALVVLSLSFIGEIDFAAGTISFDATLEGSRVLAWPVSGDVAIRTGWADRIDHVAAFGGLHPQYPRPANLPEMRRLSINFGTNNPRITLTAYAAITLNSLQFGARADLYAKGPKIIFVGQVAAEGHVYFDALIYFSPFAFDISLGGGLSLLVDGDVVAGLGFDLRLRGPNRFHIDGRVWVTIFKIDVEFGISHSWGEAQSLPTPSADGAAELRRALENVQAFEPLAPAHRTAAVAFREGDDVTPAVDPIGGIRLVQRAVPLGVRLDKIGEARLAGARTFDIKATKGGVALAAAPSTEDFVRGHFFNLSESEKLRSPAFEPHRAGFEFASDVLVFDDADAIVDSYEYEVIRLPGGADRSKPSKLMPHAGLGAEFATRFMNAHHELVARPVGTLGDALKPRSAVTTERVTFVPTLNIADTLAAPARPGLVREFALLDSVTDAQGRAGELLAGGAENSANPVVASYVATAQLRVAA